MMDIELLNTSTQQILQKKQIEEIKIEKNGIQQTNDINNNNNNNEAKISELEEKLKRMEKQINTQNASKLHLNKEKEDIMMEYDNKLRSKLEALTIKMEEMEAKNEEFVKLTAIHTLRMDELEKETKSLKEETKETDRKCKELQSKNDELMKSAAFNTSRMDEIDRKYTELHTKNDGLNEKYDELKGIKMKELEEEIKAFKLKQLLDDNKMDELEKEIKRLKEEKKEIDRKYKELQNKNDELIKSTTFNISRMEEIDRKYTELHGKNDGLNETYNGLKGQYDELMLIQNKYKDDIKEIMDNLQELKGIKIIYNKEESKTNHDDEDKKINDIICNKKETKININCNDEENEMNDNIYNEKDNKINNDEVDRERVIDDIECGSNKEEEIKLNVDREINLDGIKSTLIWNEKDVKWMKICKKSTIKMYQNNDGMDEWMVSVKDIKSDQVKFNHIIPNKDAANFKYVENMMSCQWMAKNDLIQKENDIFTIFIKFQSKQAFKTFVDLFQKISNNIKY